MKHIITILFILLCVSAFCQQQEIYDLTFSDTSNFGVAVTGDFKTFCSSYKPFKKIVVLDTTLPWNPTTFWLDDPDFRLPEKIKEYRNDEHHPYNYSFLFKDTALDKLINDSEKIALSKKAAATTSQKIALRGANYQTTHYSDKLSGVYVVASEPIFSSDNHYAFINLYIVCRKKGDEYESASAIVNIVYRKNEYHIWQKIALESFLIL